MIFLCDVIVKVSFKVSFPHLHILGKGLAKLDEIVSQKAI